MSMICTEGAQKKSNRREDGDNVRNSTRVCWCLSQGMIMTDGTDCVGGSSDRIKPLPSTGVLSSPKYRNGLFGLRFLLSLVTNRNWP